MKVQEYQRTEKQIANQTRHLQFVPDRSGEILGEAISRVGNDMFSLYEKMSAEANELVADEAFSQYRQGHIDRAYGENGYMSLKGEAAVNVASMAREALDKDYEKQVGNMNANQAKIFRRKALAFNESVSQSMMQYEFEQGQAHKKASSLGLVQTSMDQGRKVYRDPRMFQDAIIDFESKAQRYYKNIEGLNGDALSSMMAKCKSQFYKGIVEQAISDNPKNPTIASGLLNTFKKSGLLTGDDDVALTKTLRPHVEAFQVGQDIERLWKEGQAEYLAKTPDSYWHFGKPIDISETTAKLWNDKTLTYAEKTQRLAGLQHLEKQENSKRLQEQADVEERLKNKFRAGEDISTDPELMKVAPERRQFLLYGGANDKSAPEALSRLNAAAARGDLTRDVFNQERIYLSYSDTIAYDKMASDQGEKRAKVASEFKFAQGVLSKALLLADKKVKPNTKEYAQLESVLLPIVRERIAQKGMSEAEPEKLAKTIKTITSEFFIERDAVMNIIDLNRSYHEVAVREQEARLGIGKPFPIDKLVLKNTQGMPIARNKEAIDYVVTRLQSVKDKHGNQKYSEPNAEQICKAWLWLLANNNTDIKRFEKIEVGTDIGDN